MNAPRKIVFTGGGSAGHVIPNLALLEYYQARHWDAYYFGSPQGMEKNIIGTQIPYINIQSGKLRRYMTWRHGLEPFKIVWGVVQAFRALGRIKPSVVFSKGGYVAFPVVIAAWLRRIPVVAHESDLTPGLANRLSYPFVKKICVTFEKSVQYFKQANKLVVTGTPIRPSLFQGDAQRGLSLVGFDDPHKPVVLVMAGGQGSLRINQFVTEQLDVWLDTFQIIHICGQGKMNKALQRPGYYPFEYVGEDLKDLLAGSDLVVSRAGANSIYELVALQKPHILIPLSAAASRGDQLDNARFFEAANISRVVQESQLDPEAFLALMNETLQARESLQAAMSKVPLAGATEAIYEVVEGLLSSTVQPQ